MSFAGEQEAADALLEACHLAAERLDGADAVRVYEDFGDQVDPPAVVLLPPVLRWEGPGPDPRLADWTVAVVVGRSDGVQAQLRRIVPVVTRAIDEVTDFDMTSAEPDVFRAGGDELPAYILRLGVSL